MNQSYSIAFLINHTVATSYDELNTEVFLPMYRNMGLLYL